MTKNALDTQSVPARIPGVGMWFTEEDTFRYMLTVDLTKFEPEKYDVGELAERFRDRLMSAYDHLASHASCTDGGMPMPHDADDHTVEAFMPHDELAALQVIPSAIDRATLAARLPVILDDFMNWLWIGVAEDTCS